MDWNDAAGPRRDGCLERGHVHQVGRRFDVDEPRRPPSRHDRRHGWDGRVGGRDNFVAGLNIEDAKSKGQGVGAAVQADPVSSSAIGGKLLFE